MKLLHLKREACKHFAFTHLNIQNIKAFKSVQFKYSKIRYDCKKCMYVRKYVAVQARKDEKRRCAADFSLLNLPKGKSLGRSKPATDS